MRAITPTSTLFLATLLLSASALLAGPGCGGCPQAAACNAAKAAAAAPAGACGTSVATPAHPDQPGRLVIVPAGEAVTFAGDLRWTRVSMANTEILKIRAKGEDRAKLLVELKQKFQPQLAAGALRLMSVQDEVWARGSVADALEVERFLKLRGKKALSAAPAVLP